MKQKDLNQRLFNEISEIGSNGITEFSLKKIQYLISEGASMTCTDNQVLTSPMIMAVENNLYEVVKLFIENNVNINCTSFSIYKGKGFSLTPLYCAAEKGLTEIVELLLANGASTDMNNNSPISPMHIAAENNHIDVVKVLYKHGLKITVPELLFQKTVLDILSENLSPEIKNFTDTIILDNEIARSIIEPGQ